MRRVTILGKTYKVVNEKRWNIACTIGYIAMTIFLAGALLGTPFLYAHILCA